MATSKDIDDRLNTVWALAFVHRMTHPDPVQDHGIDSGRRAVNAAYYAGDAEVHCRAAIERLAEEGGR